MGDDHQHAALALYLLGALPERERADFERHLAGCDRCLDEAMDLGPTTSGLGQFSDDDIHAFLTAVGTDDPLAPIPATAPRAAPSDQDGPAREPSPGDLPASGTPAHHVPSSGTPARDLPASGTPGHDLPASGTPGHHVPSSGTPARDSPENGTPAAGIPVGGTPDRGIPAGDTATRGETPAAPRPRGRADAPSRPADNRPSSRRRRRTVVTAAAAVLLVVVAGLSVVFLRGGDPSTPGDPALVTIAEAEGSGVTLAVSIIETPTDGEIVRATVSGLQPGTPYRLYAAGRSGETFVIRDWAARPGVHDVEGRLPAPADTLASFTVALADGGPIITALISGATPTPR
ncbi:zf-HC2 domain-containing protein [Catenuloplanes atrovinosus]|uniref:Putative zinc-finger domain-containing protein n=1 Tax=Catenuloplanes atrovinosus TaxID=137266 RepID=A0AAE3YLV3_9ACTN|nr:zf-HC2 domain-containing protein [Catenuloplanes atrovinosus]MDR7274236.1 hypothetical protein [Catenuloplanes atrovinosus]